MWLINSPIGRKVVMSLTGICLILFLTFHCCMNIAAFFSGEAYNMVCEFLGSNWYAVVGTVALAALAVCHIIYAFIHIVFTPIASPFLTNSWSAWSCQMSRLGVRSSTRRHSTINLSRSH